MTALVAQKVIPKLVALLIVSLCCAWLMHHNGIGQIARLDSMSPADYVEYKRHVYQTPYPRIFLGVLALGALYLGLIEAVAFIVRRAVPKKPDA